MDLAAAREYIRRCATQRRVIFSKHARDEMRNAGAQVEDVLNALRRHRSLVSQPKGRWKVTGPDLDDDDLDEGVIVVTVF